MIPNKNNNGLNTMKLGCKTNKNLLLHLSKTTIKIK